MKQRCLWQNLSDAAMHTPHGMYGQSGSVPHAYKSVKYSRATESGG